MKTNTILALRSMLPFATLLLPSCNYRYDTVSFGAAGKAPAARTPVPKIEIDTNMSVGSLVGGSVKSRKPYDIVEAAFRRDHQRHAAGWIGATGTRGPSIFTRNLF